MRTKWLITAGVAAGIVLAAVDNAQTAPKPPPPIRRAPKAKVNTPWEAKADKNKDGIVEPKEAQKAAIIAKSKVNRPWEAMADANHDGHVSAAELKAYRFGLIDANHDGVIDALERKNFWLAKKYAVNTPLEKKYDANGDGFLTGDEAVEYLKDRIRVISTDGKAIANTPLEQEFDADGDGVISAEEADAIKDAIGV